MNSVLKNIVALCISLVAITSLATDELKSYPAPDSVPLNKNYTVEARIPNGTWTPIDVYRAWARNGVDTQTKTSLAHFDMDGTVEVKITKNTGSFTHVDIRPERFSVPCSTTATNTVVLTLTNACKLSVEFDGEFYDNLQLIANPIESDPITNNIPNTIYYGPGKHLLTNSISIESGETLYIAGGAYLKFAETVGSPRIHMSDATNVTIRGRGIIYMPGTPFGADPAWKAIVSENCTNVNVSGIILIKRNDGFCNEAYNCDDVTYKNVTVLGGAENTDGFDVFSCRNVDVSYSFFRTGDDGMIVKAKNGIDCCDVTYRQCVGWTDWTHRPICVGGVTHCEIMTNINYQNIDVIHYNENNGVHGAISILLNDEATVSDLLFKDINIEKCLHPNASYINAYIRWSDLWGQTDDRAAYRGVLTNVTFNTVEGHDGVRRARFRGYGNDLILNKSIKRGDIPIEGSQVLIISRLKYDQDTLVFRYFDYEDGVYTSYDRDISDSGIMDLIAAIEDSPAGTDWDHTALTVVEQQALIDLVPTNVEHQHETGKVIDGVKFINYSIDGVKRTNAADANVKTNEFVYNITFE